ncbi:DUF5688 family protein [Bariatricus sp. HCP28S3_D3]|uniref:DUF5688 family protein n=1 Tax=Bariatricus sp. HCP28S3_D3 TaxID=3438901 RepID=UPI003F8AA30D
MMNQKEFFDYVANHLPEHLPENLSDIRITPQDTIKHNDQTLHGIMFSDGDASPIAPVLYLNNFYEAYQDGQHLEDVMNDIAESTIATCSIGFPFSPEDTKAFISNYEAAKEHLAIHLCDTSENMERLKELVHTELSDYSMTYHIQIPQNADPDHVASVTVTESLLNSWGISKDELHQDALLVQQDSHPMLCDLESVMLQTMGFGSKPVNLLEEPADTSYDTPSTMMYVLTNADKMHGASLIAQEDILQKASDCLGGDYYILPSSVHELLLLPASGDLTAKDLVDMVQQVNATEVSEEDRLSDKVQFYNSETGILENALDRQFRLEHGDLLPPSHSSDQISYDIYQVRSDDDTRDFCFSSLKTLKHLHLQVDPSNYEKVYSGSVPALDGNGNPAETSEVLESLFEKFNLKHPADYRGRSMSVSDVVVLHENGRDTAHFCDSIGFVEVPQFFSPLTSVSLETAGLHVEGHDGTWHTIEQKEILGHDFFLMEHDEFGSDVANVVVDNSGKLVAENLWDGFNQDIVRMITEEQGFLSDKTAVQTASLTNDSAAAPASPTERNYLKAAEEYQEENYDCIDGRMSTQNKLTPGDDTESHPEQRPSVLGKLRDKQAQVSTKTITPKPEKSHTHAPSLD